MMRSESTSAFGQPRDTSPTRGADPSADLSADLGADLGTGLVTGLIAGVGAGLGARRSLLSVVEDLRASLPAVLCMCGLLTCARGGRKRLSINAPRSRGPPRPIPFGRIAVCSSLAHRLGLHLMTSSL